MRDVCVTKVQKCDHLNGFFSSTFLLDFEPRYGSEAKCNVLHIIVFFFILKRPKASTTTYGLNSWTFTAPKLWNSLPDSSRTVQTYKAFKNSIRTVDLAGLL